MNKISIIFFIFFSTLQVNGHIYTEKLDSLNQLITSSNNSTSVAKWKLETTWLTKSDDLDSSITVAENSLRVLEKADNKEGIAIAYSYLGVYYYLKKEYPKNLNYLLKAEQYFKELGNEYRLAKVYNNLGNTYGKLYDLPTAITFYNKSLELKEKSPIKVDISPNLINIATIYYGLGNYKKCNELNERALIVCFQLDDFESIAIIYSNMGASYERLGDYKKSINYLLKSLDIYHEDFSDRKAEIRTYTNLGSTYLSLNEYSDARFYYKRALSLNEELNSSSLQTVLLNNLAEVERQSNNISLARQYVNQALEIATTNNNLEEESVAYNELYLIENNAKNYELALSHYIKFIELSDSLTNLYNINQTKISLLQNEIELGKIQNKKDLLIEYELNKKKSILNLLVWSFLISILFWIVLFFRKKSLTKLTQIINFIIPLLGSAIAVLFLFLETRILVNNDVIVFFSIVLIILFASIGLHLFLNYIFNKQKK